MADNSQQILDDVLSQQRQDLIPEVSEHDYFEVFCAEQILKDFDLLMTRFRAESSTANTTEASTPLMLLLMAN
ncbi:hypothetical protein [Rhizobium leguminosarum]|uniref:hypothetical protein n=1 Tax=Rhizobium leguminosarum TaxID=384 RepID=UPI001C96FB82|nr:hypothetical protein [Rhizobium leguminosarum]MBY5350010.1 hypothetical protein [Rhizobium leguminosarum]